MSDFSNTPHSLMDIMLIYDNSESLPESFSNEDLEKLVTANATKNSSENGG